MPRLVSLRRCLAVSPAVGITFCLALASIAPAAESRQVPEPRGAATGDPSPPQAPSGQGRGGPRGGFFHELEPDDTASFVQIFDKTLSGWDGDPTFWRVESGAIVAESTPEKVVKQNTFLIWRGERVKDFELKVQFRMNGTNSGIQVRSAEMPEVGKWVLKGYQADIDFTNGFTGNIHEERGRNVLVPRGRVVRIVDGPKYKAVGTVNDGTLLRGIVNINGWNEYHIIARGPVLMQFMNGQLTAVLIDEDSASRASEGLLGFQMHTGPPFKIEFRNIWFRKL
jgi:hypothetical protein